MPLKNKKRKVIEEAAERLAEIIVMQIKDKKKNTKDDFQRETKRIQEDL